MDVKKICSALVMGATLLTVQAGTMQAFGDAKSDRQQQIAKYNQLRNTPGTPEYAKRVSDDQAIYRRSHTKGTSDYNKRLAGDARMANTSRIEQGRRRAADVENYRQSHTSGTSAYAKRISADQNNYRVSHTAGTAQYTARVNEDVKIGNASRARREAWALAHHKH